jgi:hypothetical protein
MEPLNKLEYDEKLLKLIMSAVNATTRQEIITLWAERDSLKTEVSRLKRIIDASLTDPKQVL